MSRRLAHNIYHLLRGAARRTTLDELRKEGRRNLTVLHFRDVEALIGKAVDNSLKRRGLNLQDSGLRDEVRLEFLALMRERDQLAKTVEDLLHQQDQLAHNRERLDRALADAAVEYESATHDVEQDEARQLDQLAQRLRTQLRGLLKQIDPELAARSLALVERAFDEQRALSAAREQALHAERLRTIERRMARLKAKLHETEDMLEKARTQSEPGQEPIPGVPVSPGLDDSDPSFETKKELLAEIFRLNVELSEMLDKN